MKHDQIKRRTLLSTAAGVLAAGAVTTLPQHAYAAADEREQLGDYASHTTEGRSITVTSVTGQRLRLTPYGDQMVRVRAARAGEDFFSDTRYEMVQPQSHTSLGGSLTVKVNTNTLEFNTSAGNGLRIVLQKKPLRLEFYARDTGALLAKEDSTRSITWSGTNHSVTTGAFVPPPAEERFLKAGHGVLGRTPRLDRTGDTVSHNYADAAAAADNPNNQAPAIVPFYLSSKGYGVFFNTTFDTTFSFGGTNGYSFFADAHDAAGVRPQLDYFLVNGPRFAQLLDRYTQLTGRPRLPQLSIFGLHMSDKSFASESNQAWWREKVGLHRAAGFPFDHQVNDNRWREGSGSWSGSWFEFSDERWPDPADYQKWASENGVTVTLDYNRNNTNEMAGWKGGPPPGYSIAAADLQKVKENNSVPDWSNPDARAWVWKVFWDKALDPSLGFPGDALWIDETDDLGGIPYTARMADGRTWAEDRNAYFLNLHKGVGEEGWDPSGAGHIGSAKRPWTWSRGATAGQQRYGHYWTGDISQTYDEMRNQIRGMQTAGLGGFPFANIDGGGFDGGTVSDAFYRNWPVAWSSLSPIWRPHTSASVKDHGKKASRWPLDQSTQAQAEFAKYSHLRYSLMPYIYTLAHQASATGMPMARAMVIDYQDRTRAYSRDLQYLWGPSLLVAPLTSDGGAVQQVWLPAGVRWYNFWTDAKHTGSDTTDLPYSTRTGEAPLFVKAGAVLPKYPYAQSTAYLSKRQLEVDVYAGADGVFELVEDDGVTEEYRTAKKTSVTRLTFTDSSTRVTIAHPQGTYDGAPGGRRYVVRIHGLDSPVGMRVNGGSTLPAFTSEAAAVLSDKGTGCAWDAGTKVLSVVTPVIPVSTGGGNAATIEPSGASFPQVGGGTVHQAETARLDSAYIIDTVHAGYTGTGYADSTGTAATGSTLAWTVAVPTAGRRQLIIRYANGGNAERPLAIDVNGTRRGTLAMPPTGGWDTWASASLTADLPRGESVTIRATLTQSQGANIDSLTVQ
ncbi:TIM-barrel domain-containing protein [Streptomyces sp. NPDC102409]|uniref:TIM-barrel domain-containing protein n=1 Tax=Streptomyces sp. NPDC102409 TaxID=3366172 RepID=UPI0037F4821A